MTNIFLFIFCVVLLTATTLNLDVSIAPGMSIKNLLLYLIFFFIAAETAVARNRKVELAGVLLPYFMFVVYGVLTWLIVLTLFDYPRYRPLPTLVSLKGGLIDRFLIFLVFFYGVLSARDSLWVFRKLIWAILLVNIVTVIDTLNIPDLGLFGVDIDGRALGPLNQANEYGAFCAVFIPAMVALFLLERGAKRVLVGIGVFATVLALLMTASRGAIVGLAGALILGVIYLRHHIATRTIVQASIALAVFCVVALTVLVVAGYGQLFEDRFIGQTQSRGMFEVSSGRTYIWSVALGKMMDYPVTLLTGFGWSVYEFSNKFRYATHSTYVNIFFNLGIIGLSLFVITATKILASARRALESADKETFHHLVAFQFGFLTVLVSLAFSELTSPWIFIWAYAGLMMRLSLATEQSHVTKT